MFTEGNVPKGGTCLSVFLVLKEKDGILVGKMTKPEIWIDKIMVGEMFAPKYVSSNKWVIPASHLKYGEKPDDAAARVLAEQICVSRVKPSFLGVQSHLSVDPNDPEAAHWDICFVYGARLGVKQLARPEWFSELVFQKPATLKSEDFTRGHGDILLELGVVKQ